MNITKKLLSILLVLSLTLIYFSIPVIAEESETETFDITYTETEGLSISFNVQGEITVVDQVHTCKFAKGVPVTVTFEAESGYQLKSIKANGINLAGVSGKIKFTYNFETDAALVVTVEEKTVQTAVITVNSGENFTYVLQGADEENKAPVGTEATLIIMPDEGYIVKKLLYNNSEKDPSNEYTFTVGQSNVFTITVEKEIIVSKKTLTVNIEGGGKVTPESGTKFDEGSKVEIILTPNTGYILSSLKIGDENVPLSQVVNNKFSFTINDNTTISAIFVKQIMITASIGNGGTVTVNGSNVSGSKTIKVAEGKNVIILVSPSLGYTVDSVKVDNSSVTLDDQNSFTIPAINESKRLSVTFKPISSGTKQYTISASAGTGGIITPGTTVVEEGKSVTFTVTPDNGKEVDTVKVDGQAVSLINFTYTFNNVAAPHNIYVTFKDISGGEPGQPIKISDINWDSGDTVYINITNSSIILSEVFQKITDDCKEKTVVFVSEDYKWTLPKGQSLQISSESADLKIDINGSLYSEVTDVISQKVENIKMMLVTYENSLMFPQGTKLEVKLGNIFAGKEIQQLIYDRDLKELSNPKNSTGEKEYDVRTVDADGWVKIDYYNDKDIVFCDVLDPYYTITATASDGGSINPVGIKKVKVGSDASFSITAHEGYVISSLLVDNVEVSEAAGETSYVRPFSAVSEDHTISVTFVAIEDYEESKGSGGSNSGLIVSLIIISLAAAGAAALFIIKWRQNKY